MTSLLLAILGLIFGSFAGAQAWRLRAHELAAENVAGVPHAAADYEKLSRLLGKKVHEDRSQCLHCGHELKWFELVPLASWLWQRARCRACGHPIGLFEPTIELAVAFYFVFSYRYWPGGIVSGLDIAHFVLWLTAGVAMAILIACDLKWRFRPRSIIILLAAIGLVVVALHAAESLRPVSVVLSAIGAGAMLGGFFALVSVASGGRRLDLDEIQLGLALGLLLPDWRTAMLALLLAVVVGCLILVPLLVIRRLDRRTIVPIGPFLIAGTVLAWLF